jgi:lysophospholipase L1-like esterase
LNDGDSSCRLGVLAFGDSITNGGGELQWGVAMRSWAEWVARGLGLPFTNYAVDGNRATDVLHAQIPAFSRRALPPDARYDLGCLYIGVNDVRAADWDAETFNMHFRFSVGFLLRRCDRVLVVTAPSDLGRPRAGGRVAVLNAMIEKAARESGALLLDLSDFRGRNLVMADHVHPTAFGQIAIAERALEVLETAGLEVRARPSQLITYDMTRWRRLRGDATYAYRHLKVSARSAGLRAWALGAGRRPQPGSGSGSEAPTTATEAPATPSQRP